MTEQQSLAEQGTATTTARPCLHSSGMVAGDAEELVADEPEVPVLSA
jgi:hypothetical protein